MRKRLGAALAREHPLTADLVMPFPDSGTYAALGYAAATGIPFEMGVIRNHYVGRTFIQPSQSMRDFSVRIKLNPVREILKGQRVVVIEDSIIRGTTTRSRVKSLRDAGAKEVSMLVSCPPHRFPCYYGIDFSSQRRTHRLPAGSPPDPGLPGPGLPGLPEPGRAGGGHPN